VTPADLQEWAPCRLHHREDRLFVEWCHLGSRRFLEPFFGETIERCLEHPANQPARPQTPIEELATLQTQRPGLAPNGFIFHMSRCGSTLLAQMLAALPQNVVLSEAEPIDAVLSAHRLEPSLPRELQIEWLRGIVSAVGQQRHPQERHLFVKMDSWHTAYLPLIHEAFPEVPWIFLYRDPVEVMVSHRRHPGRQMVPGAAGATLLGVTAIDACLMAPEEYCARVLAAICRQALDACGPSRCLLLNYLQLPDAGYQLLPAHFGVDYSCADLEAMRQVASLDAKRPRLRFSDDTAAKQSEATDEQRGHVERWVGPLYRQLEKLRRHRSNA
jgi:hypothetical protein